MRGTPYLLAWRHTVSDWGSTPPLAQNTAHRAVQHAQRTLDLHGKVNVAGRVDNVDLMPAPFSRSSQQR